MGPPCRAAGTRVLLTSGGQFQLLDDVRAPTVRHDNPCDNFIVFGYLPLRAVMGLPGHLTYNRLGVLRVDILVQ